jgi:hypothetical protein
MEDQSVFEWLKQDGGSVYCDTKSGLEIRPFDYYNKLILVITWFLVLRGQLLDVHCCHFDHLKIQGDPNSGLVRHSNGHK